MEDLTNPYEIDSRRESGRGRGGAFILFMSIVTRGRLGERGRSLRRSLRSVELVTFETLVLIQGPDADSLLELTD